MKAHEIRQSFLDYFAGHGHRIVASSSLVPTDDPTLLFTNAGMNQFKDLFLGKERRDYRRATTSQKVMRVSGKHNDLDNVGPSHRHHTFFEMLGNFSFGDYFKADAIPFAWRLLTEVWGMDPSRMYPTIFKGEAGVPRDDEAFAIWTQFVPADRITELGSADNFWQMGDTGPCGRCSEIMYYRPDAPCDQPVCRGLECSCDRYFEIWNNVFMEFNRTDDGTLHPLPALSVDTGMGLERVTSVLQGKFSNYDTDIFLPLLDAIGAAAGRPYTHFHGGGDHPDVSMRVIADHLRAMTFLIADGVVPSNEWRGYVLRKIMRRAMRHGKRLGFTDPFLYRLVDVVVAEMGAAYPELVSGHDAIVRTVHAEEDRFDLVLTSGLPRLEDLIERTQAAGASTIPGDEVFRLYDSLGVPYDFADDLAGQRGLTIDRAGYEQALDAQRERARASSAFETKKTIGFEYPDDATRTQIESLPDVFDGYAFTEVLATEVLALFDSQRRLVPSLPASADGYVVLDRTPFYVESGGQVSDTGILRIDGDVAATVTGMSRVAPGAARVHRVTTAAPLAAGQRVDAVVDAEVRDATRRNHTATHLLHAALRARLGTHVRQKGSLVAPGRLRFDFDHFQPMTAEDRLEVERAVNAQVYRDTPVVTEEKSTDEAVKAGAMALFGEKYGDRVRVVQIAGYSTELCGGTHVRATGEIGPFVLTEETGVAAGIRRIEALTGAEAVTYLQRRGQTLEQASAALGVPVADTIASIEKLQAETRRLARENAQLKVKVALGGGSGRTDDDAVIVGDARLVTRRVTGLDKDALRGLSDSLRDRIGRGVVVLAAENDDKVQLLVSVSKDLTSTIKAGQLVKDLAPIVGGKGGGRPDFAEAGGRDVSQIDALLTTARDMVTQALG
ncbi:MAG: alanine--tRNA ligase [Acidobacteria bacterium SCN 69-37]|nr:MAG: alanine--tRNA ligase [Acidobacteria bacterium SCN 69-37]